MKTLIAKARNSLAHDLPLIGWYLGEALMWLGAAAMIPGSLVYGLGNGLQDSLENAL